MSKKKNSAKEEKTRLQKDLDVRAQISLLRELKLKRAIDDMKEKILTLVDLRPAHEKSKSTERECKELEAGRTCLISSYDLECFHIYALVWSFDSGHPWDCSFSCNQHFGPVPPGVSLCVHAPVQQARARQPRGGGGIAGSTTQVAFFAPKGLCFGKSLSADVGAIHRGEMRSAIWRRRLLPGPGPIRGKDRAG